MPKFEPGNKLWEKTKRSEDGSFLCKDGTTYQKVRDPSTGHFVSTKAKNSKGKRKIVALPDMHNPWMNWEAFYAAVDYIKWYKPDVIIQLGDIIDAKAWSRYPKDTDDLSPAAEWDQVEIALHKIHEKLPNLIITMGNHDVRPAKKALEASIPLKLMKQFHEVFPFDGWDWRHEGIIVDGVLFCHGDELAGVTPAQKAIRACQSVIHGHDHLAQLEYVSTKNNQMFGMSAGWLGDADAIAFKYAIRNARKSTLGFATLTDGIPNFIPIKK